jgi:carboxyl-terminal processing protease
MKRASLRFRVLLFCAFLLLLTTPNLLYAASSAVEGDAQEVYNLIKTYHINPGDLKPGAIDEMLKKLGDPYTQYFTQEEFESFLGRIDGSFTGVGIMVEEKDGFTWVMNPIPGSPADQAGILKGDKIIAVDGHSVIGLPIEEVIARIKGEEGTPVTLTMERGKEKINFKLIRAKIQMPLVESEYDSENKIGYIQIISFGDRTASLMKESLSKLTEQGMESLILDVRGNPGGRLDSVIDVASLFIGEGPVLWVKDNKGSMQALEVSNGTWWDKPIVLLTDQYSASASEILASALRDYELATLVGTNTFGKGTVQTMIPLSSGNVLKLTIEEYFSAKKGKINKIGVKPHITVSNPEEQLPFARELAKGIKSISLGADGKLELNGQRITLLDDLAVKEKDWYISLYRLKLMFGGELSWDNQTKTATYKLRNQAISFTMGKDPVLIKDQRMYVPVEALKGLSGLDINRDENMNWLIHLK